MSNSLPAALFITGLKSIALFLPDRTATALSSVFSSISIINYWTAKSLALHLPHSIIIGQSRGYGTGDRIQDTGGGGHTALGLWDRRQENKTQETEDILLWGYGTGDKRTRHRRRRTYCSGVMGQETREQDTGDGGHTALGLWDRRQENKTQETEDILLWGYGTGDKRTRHRRRRTQGSGLKGQDKGKGIALWGYGAGVGEEDRRDEGYSTSGL